MEVLSSDNGRRRGKGYICLVRQSDDKDGPTSTEAQLVWLQEEGKRMEMRHVEDYVLVGVTGSMPGKRGDLDAILERKRERGDFDVVLVQRLDRLTRGGSDHGAWFHHEAARLGIEIIYVGEDIPQDGAYRGMIMAAKFDAAREQAKSIGQRSVQGWVHSLKLGLNCVTSRTPIGCDRIYLNSEGEPQFIIRNLGDGRQQKLDAKTGTVIDTYGTIGNGQMGHYRKQRSEGVELCPGAPEDVETVRLIFDLRYNRNWRGKRIADMLNRQGRRSATGIGWGQHQVETIYENPTYCGVAIGSRRSQGIFYRRGKDGPEPLNLPQHVLANCRTAPKQLRPPADWVWQDQPLLKDFLPSALRNKALPLIEQRLIEEYERSINADRPKRSSNKHKDSAYVLTGRLVAKQDGAPLTGVLCGKVGKKKRKYRHRRGQIGYRKGSIFNNYMDAESLESAVFKLIVESTADAPQMQKRIEAAVEREAGADEADRELESLESRRKKVAEKVERLYLADEEDKADLEPALKRLKAERRELDAAIADMRASLAHAEFDPAEVTARVQERMASLTAADLAALPAPAKRELVEAFVERVEVDMETRDAEVFLRLPSWALESSIPANGGGRLAAGSASPTIHETHPASPIRLAWADCRYRNVHGSQEPVCYRCRRKAG